MTWRYDQFLDQVVKDLKDGEERRVTVRELLREFGYYRRGVNQAAFVKQTLKKYELNTIPDFLNAYMDERLQFQLIESTPQPTEPREETDPESSSEPTTPDSLPASVPGGNDPTYRINRLEAANLEAAEKTLVTIASSSSIEAAVTEMLAHDFSQLPVMNGKTVKGIISWQSLGQRLALGRRCTTVDDALEQAVIVKAETPLFVAIKEIVQHGYVLVQRKDKTISGIVTTSDMSVQFQTLAEPFLILAEIENHLRALIDQTFTAKELEAVREPSDGNRAVVVAANLTFGEYVRLLENEERWAKLNLNLDRVAFRKKLDAVRVIRNDVMHFDPEGIAEQDLETLRGFVKFLQDLRQIGVF